MTPSNHSDEATYTPNTVEVRDIHAGHHKGYGIERLYEQQGEQFDRWLAAHDAALVAATKAQQWAAKRDDLAAWLSAQNWSDVSRQMNPQVFWLNKASALLAPTGPLLDAGEVWDAALDWVADGYQDTTAWKARNPYRGAPDDHQ